MSELPTGSEKDALVHAMFDRIASRYDVLNRIMTFGLDRGWRRRCIELLGLERPSVVLDLACGTGDLLVELARHGHRGVGVDLSLPMLRAGASSHSAERRSATVALAQGDGAKLPLASGCLDGLVSGFALRNFSRLDAVFAEAARVLRPGGRLCVLEVDRPRSPLIGFGHRLWLGQAVPRIGALLSDKDAYAYLPRSLSYLPSRSELGAILERAGFVEVDVEHPTLGIVQIVTATRAGDAHG